MRHSGVFALAILLLAVAPASASLIGDEVQLDLMYDLDNIGPGGTVFNGTAIVGAGAEFTIDIFSDIGSANAAEGTFVIDLDSESVTFSQSNSPWPDVLEFDLLLSGLDWVGMSGSIVGVNALEQNAFDISFGADWLQITNTVNFNPPSNFTNLYELEVQHAQTPEPATMALLGIGLLGMGVARRKRNA